jgi:hypothetical protein
MAKESKHICKWDKDEIRDELDKLKEIVTAPRYICRKCGRVAKESSYLCKPVDL